MSAVKTNKDLIKQPQVSIDGTLPKAPFGLIMVGRSGSGKSTLLYNLMSEMLKDYFDFILIFSPVKTDDVLKSLELPDENYIQEFDEDSISSIMSKLEKLLDDDFEKNVNECKTLFIFDDILSEQKLLKSNTMKKIASASRHFNISWIILSQYYKALPPIIRTNASAIVLFPSSRAEIEKFSEEQCLPNMSHQDFVRMVQDSTKKPYSFFYLNHRADHGKKARSGWDDII